MNRRYAWIVVALLWVVAVLNYLDRQIIFSVLPLLKVDLNLTAGEMGLLSAVFLWIYAFLSPFAGYLADRFGSVRMILTGLLVWSAVTLAAAAGDEDDCAGVGDATCTTDSRSVRERVRPFDT